MNDCLKLKSGICFLMYGLINLIDKDEKKSIQEIEKHMNDKTLINFLREEYKDNMYTDIFEPEYPADDVNNAICNFAGYIDGNEDRKYGVSNEENGLLLLISICVDILDHDCKITK